MTRSFARSSTRGLSLAALLLAGLVAGLSASPLAAQEPAAPPPAERDSLEARVRQRMGQIVKKELGLSDEQMRRLQATNRRFEGQRRALFEQEREVRTGLRDEMMSGDTTRNAQVAVLLDRMLVLQRRRLDLMETEQKELATFLTPIQRARYFGMEEQVRRRVMEMRQQRDPGGPGGMQGRRPGTPPSQPRSGRRPPG
jgi:Spy/CpxP family protein refolding chaperone